MTIKGTDGQSYNVTGQGQGTFNSVGSAATGAVEVITSDDKPISRYEAAMMDNLAKKDAEIAQLKADKYTDEKIVEATKYVDVKIENLAKEVRANKEEQAAINLQQATYNGVNTATIQCMQGQIAQLLGLTTRACSPSARHAARCASCSAGGMWTSAAPV